MSNESIRELFIQELEEVKGGGISASIDTTLACCEEILNPHQCCL